MNLSGPEQKPEHQATSNKSGATKAPMPLAQVDLHVHFTSGQNHPR